MPKNIPITIHIICEKMDKPQAVGLGLFLSHKGERLRKAAEGSVRLLAAFLRLVYIISDKTASRGYWWLCGAVNTIVFPRT